MRYEIRNAIRILRERGLWGIHKRMATYLQAPSRLKRIKGYHGEDRLDRLIDFVFTGCSGLFKPYQVRTEVRSLMQMVERSQPKTLLEIGTAMGGNLFLFCQMAAPDATIVSVDLPGGKFGNGYPTWRIPLYKRFAREEQAIHLVRADSHDPQTVERAREILSGAPVDFLFVDGDHTYEGVKRDFDFFSPLVAKGGHVGFHDIVPHKFDDTCGVDRLWEELKTKHESYEFIEDMKQGWAGIGVLKRT